MTDGSAKRRHYLYPVSFCFDTILFDIDLH